MVEVKDITNEKKTEKERYEELGFFRFFKYAIEKDKKEREIVKSSRDLANQIFDERLFKIRTDNKTLYIRENRFFSSYFFWLNPITNSSRLFDKNYEPIIKRFLRDCEEKFGRGEIGLITDYS